MVGRRWAWLVGYVLAKMRDFILARNERQPSIKRCARNTLTVSWVSCASLSRRSVSSSISRVDGRSMAGCAFTVKRGMRRLGTYGNPVLSRALKHIDLRFFFLLSIRTLPLFPTSTTTVPLGSCLKVSAPFQSVLHSISLRDDDNFIHTVRAPVLHALAL